MHPSGRLDRLSYAVLDVETTGFVPGRHRIIEIAVAVVDPGRSVEMGLDTVLSVPDGGATRHIHGIPAALETNAPEFSTIVGNLLRCLAGRVLVGHNVSFDLRHLRAELDRCGIHLPEIPFLDTMALDSRLFGIPRRRLADACAVHGVAPGPTHMAGADAQSTAALLTALLAVASTRRIATVSALNLLLPTPTLAAPLLDPALADAFPTAPTSTTSRHGNRLRRDQARLRYAELLTLALADTELSSAEARALAHARRGLTASDVRALHGQAFAAAILLFCQDTRVDDAEASYLHRLARALSSAGWCPGDPLAA